MNRRKFATTLGLAAASSAIPVLGQSANKNSKLRLLQIGVGGIGGLDRNNLKTHPKVEIAGLCDINKNHLDKVAKEFPKAATYADAREALTKDIDKYDGVIVCTPDHSHAVYALTALANDKHLYLQKPVVQQLEEVGMLKKALAAKPGLANQMGNQRSAIAGRKQATAIVRSGDLGKAITAWAWTGEVKKGNYFDDPWLPKYYDATPVPSHINWDLWKHCSTVDVPYNDGLAHRRWRTYWEFGGGQLTDWCCHLLDFFYLALDLDVPTAVQTNTPKPATEVGHSAYNQSHITYNKTKFTVGEEFVVHYNDHGIHPPCIPAGLPLGSRFSTNHSIIVCEGGTVVLAANGGLSVFKDGKKVENYPMPKVEKNHHWHDWVDNAFGAKNALLGNLEMGARVTEAGLLATKATRYPNRELPWDSAAGKFKDAAPNKSLLKRTYRDGFAPPAEFA